MRFEPWPWIVALGLGAMIATSLAFAGAAYRHPDPLVVDDAYAAGLRWNEERRARERADEAGWRFELATSREGGAVRVELALRDRRGAELRPERLSVRRVRPSEGGFDADFELGPDGSALIPLPRPGRWELVATAELGDRVLERRYRIGP